MNDTINFGKYKGERWTRLPVHYLRWIVNDPAITGNTKRKASSELRRRGTKVPTSIQLSGHAIDRASQITKAWRSVGVYTWLLRISEQAFAQRERNEEIIAFKGFKFAFAYGEYYPILKTIMINEKKHHREKIEQ
jgi:hypothetical protein